ncbi:hypothetical protein EYF80_016971 [Liparis tanakae]|uniref:Uncharacterized protein n=1 Tax=Liparis tanakae TaxID=230148 RepID=A0A4Z2I4V9_9TELE|nr:hypothetical protein EYF80_016971 [Liparis tanakae]
MVHSPCGEAASSGEKLVTVMLVDESSMGEMSSAQRLKVSFSGDRKPRESRQSRDSDSVCLIRYWARLSSSGTGLMTPRLDWWSERSRRSRLQSRSANPLVSSSSSPRTTPLRSSSSAFALTSLSLSGQRSNASPTSVSSPFDTSGHVGGNWAAGSLFLKVALPWFLRGPPSYCSACRRSKWRGRSWGGSSLASAPSASARAGSRISARNNTADFSPSGGGSASNTSQGVAPSSGRGGGVWTPPSSEPSSSHSSTESSTERRKPDADW